MRYRVLVHESNDGYDVSVPSLPCCRASGKTEGEAVENIKRAIAEHLSPSDIQPDDGRIREVEVPVLPAHMNYDLVMMARELTGTDDTEGLVHEALQALIQRESAKRLAALGGTEPQLKITRRRRALTR
jgi:predicted RNase H-like HicB family nuclease